MWKEDHLIKGTSYRKKYCFIILHYQAMKETLACIQSIKQLNNQPDIGIVVIDNASPNGSGEKLRQTFAVDEQIIVECNQHNEGFSRGNNIGCKIARDIWNPDYYIVTNNDTVFLQSNFLNLIDQEYQKSKFAILGPDIIRIGDQLHQSPISATPPSLLRTNITIIVNSLIQLAAPYSYFFLKKYYYKMSGDNAGNNDHNQYQKNVCLMGACMIFSKAFVEKKIYVFAPETQFYYEEYILALYCKNHNQDIVYNPNIVVWHNEGIATEDISKIENERIKFRVGNILNSAKIYRKFLLEYRKGKIGDSRYNSIFYI